MPDTDQLLVLLTEMLYEQTSYEGEITLETNLCSDLNFDSLDAAEFAMNLEEVFDLEVTDEDVSEIRTVGEAVALLQKLRVPA